MNISYSKIDYKKMDRRRGYGFNPKMDDGEEIDLNDALCDDMENNTITENPSNTALNIVTRNQDDCLASLMKRMGMNKPDKEVYQETRPTLDDTLENDVLLNNSMWSILSHLDTELYPIKSKSQKNIIQRLSQEFINSPCKFTEKLVTIIEESAMNNSDAVNDSGVSLARLSQEFKKLCKFIEDESMPDMAPSFIDFTPDSPDNVSFLTKWKIQTTPAKKCFASIRDETISHLSGTKNQRIRHTINSPSVLSDSVALFEQLEAECNKMYSEKPANPLRSKASSETSYIDQDDLHSICEKQMASLEDTFNDVKSFSNVDRTYLPTLSPEVLPKPTSELVNYETPPSRRIGKKPFNGNTPVHERDVSQNISPRLNEFDRSVLYEIAEQRQRCLNTAKTILKINSDLKTTQVEKSFEKLKTPDKNNDNENNLQFLNTLMSCEKYFTYLQTNRDTLTNLIKDPSHTEIRATPELISFDSPKCNAKINGKENLSPIVLSYNCKNVNETKMSPLKSMENKSTPKPRLFSSPGKSSVKLVRKKPVAYFTNATTNNQKVREMKHKSPYNVVSPIALYINGNDNGLLLKHVLSKTGRTPLTPQTRTSSKTISPRLKSTGKTS